MKTFTILLAAWLCAAAAFAQATLYGKVTDAGTGEPIPFCSVALYQNGVLLNGKETDFDGNYAFSDIGPGAYDVEVTYVGYAKKRISGVRVLAGKANVLDIEMTSEGVVLDEVVVTEYHVPLVEQDNTTSGAVITSGRIRPSRTGGGGDRKDRKSRKGGSGETLSIRGSRSDAADYYIDGVRVSGARVPEGAVVRERSGPAVPAGQLTAGEWSDLINWETWVELLEEDFETYSKTWSLAPRYRYTVEVRNDKGLPLAGCRASLLDDRGQRLWATLADNNGIAELWAPDKATAGAIALEYQGVESRIEQPQPYTKAINRARLPTPCREGGAADIYFVVDATSSMADEIRYLKAELEDAILRAERNLPDVELRTGALFYRDQGDAYLTRRHALQPELDSTLAFLRQQEAGGGGDYEEALDVALAEAVSQENWNPEANARLLFLVLDAPPHQRPEAIESLQQSVRMAAGKGIRIIPVASSGVNKSTEYLMKALAISTNGAYTFLTNHSGIGGSHIEPTAGPYDVLLLNDLLVRLMVKNAMLLPCPEEQQPEPFAAESYRPSLLAEVECFPNPAAGQFYLRLKEDFSRLAIRNINGQLIQETEQISKGDHEFSAENWAPGLYLLELHRGNEVAVEKLVVERR